MPFKTKKCTECGAAAARRAGGLCARCYSVRHSVRLGPGHAIIEDTEMVVLGGASDPQKPPAPAGISPLHRKILLEAVKLYRSGEATEKELIDLVEMMVK